MNVVFIGLGGAIGALLRYLIDFDITNRLQSHFPLGTLIVNIIGCFIIGAFFKIFYYNLIHTRFSSFIIVGFLGALTTFSSYAYTTLRLYENGQFMLATLNLVLNNFLGILFAFLGDKIFDILINRYFRSQKTGSEKR